MLQHILKRRVRPHVARLAAPRSSTASDPIKTELNTLRDRAAAVPTNSEQPKKRGIVVVAGGKTYFTNAYVLIARLRNELGCRLPIEVWHRESERSDFERRVWRSMKNVSYRCLEDEFGAEIPGKYSIKPVAMKLSSFDEILMLDADNNCIRDPEFLFDHPRYKRHGAIFFPDHWANEPSARCYQLLSPADRQKIPLWTQESGQVLIDRRRCARALELCVNMNLKFHDRMTDVVINCPGGNGDKDSFQVAWLLTGTDFWFVPFRTGTAGYLDQNGSYKGTTMCQYAPDGTPLFLHKNWIKFHEQERSGMWQVMKRWTSQKDTGDVVEMSTWDFKSERPDGVEVIDFIQRFGAELEDSCFAHLTKLRALESREMQ
jgi:alpha 1,2-mannosyltransferase